MSDWTCIAHLHQQGQDVETIEAAIERGEILAVAASPSLVEALGPWIVSLHSLQQWRTTPETNRLPVYACAPKPIVAEPQSIEILGPEVARILGITRQALVGAVLDDELQPRLVERGGKEWRIYQRAIVEAFATRDVRALLAERAAARKAARQAERAARQLAATTTEQTL